jgi:hypothetical protein
VKSKLEKKFDGLKCHVTAQELSSRVQEQLRLSSPMGSLGEEDVERIMDAAHVAGILTAVTGFAKCIPDEAPIRNTDLDRKAARQSRWGGLGLPGGRETGSSINSIMTAQSAWKRYIQGCAAAKTSMQAAAMGEMMMHVTLGGDTAPDQEVDSQDKRTCLEENRKRCVKTQGTCQKSWMRTSVTDAEAQHDVNVTPAHSRMEEDLALAVLGLLDDPDAMAGPRTRLKTELPENCLSVALDWHEQGGVKLQQTLTRHAQRSHFQHFVSTALRSDSGCHQRHFRSMLGAHSNAFLRAMPEHEAGSCTDEEFVWLVRDRLTLHQPQLNAVRGKKRAKGCSGVLNEEHIIKCMCGPEKHEIHTQFALVINDVMKHAGRAAVLELRCLVPGDGGRRHADVLAKGVKLSGSNCNRVGVDVTVRAPDFSGASDPRRRPGVAANAAEKEKRNVDDKEKKLRRNGVNYFPLAVESNGALGPSLINSISTKICSCWEEE